MKRCSHSGRKRSSKKRFAASMLAIPASRSSATRSVRFGAYTPVVLLSGPVVAANLNEGSRRFRGAAVMSTLMRGILFSLRAGTLALALSGNAAAQDASSSAAQTSSQAQTARAADSAQPGQPMSLGDLARLARAKKQSEPKAGKVIDEDNLPRSGGRNQHRRQRSRRFVRGPGGQKFGLALGEGCASGFLGIVVWSVPSVRARSEAAASDLRTRSARGDRHQRGQE